MAEMRLQPLMRIYFKNNPAKCHPDPSWNDGYLGFFEERCSNKKTNNNNKIISDMRSLLDPKILQGHGRKNSESLYMYNRTTFAIQIGYNV